MRVSSIIVVFIMMPLFGFSAVIHVPDDYPTIQEAIDAALIGDMVLVSPGTFGENIDFKGKAIWVKSLEGPDVTVIDGNQNGSVVSFVSNEMYDSVLDGFTITNGTGTDDPTNSGGGIYCTASPRIVNNLIKNNTVSVLGGGICCRHQASPVILNNIITENSATGWSGCGGGIVTEYGYPAILNNLIVQNSGKCGGGIFCEYGSVIISNNIIIENTSGFGGGMHLWAVEARVTNNIIAENSGDGVYLEECSPFLTHNTIVNNSGSGVYCEWTFNAVITNTIIWDNSLGSIYYTFAPPEVNHCDVQGGWQGTGNIDADPLFVDPEEGNFHISCLSPCIDAGDNLAPYIPESDMEGDPRIIPHGYKILLRTLPEAVADIGADEYCAYKQQGFK